MGCNMAEAGVLSRGAQTLLLLVIVLTTGITFAVSSLQRMREKGSVVSVTFGGSTSPGESVASLATPPAEHNRRALICPSSIQDMLISQRDEPEALPWTKTSIASVQQCPLINNPIYHTRPADNTLATRLLIYISHQLRTNPTSRSHGSDNVGEWLFFLDPATITSHSAHMTRERLLPIAGDQLSQIHVILSGPDRRDSNIHSTTPDSHQDPLRQPLQAHTGFYAIRISAFSKVLLERVLTLQKGSTKRTEGKAVAIAVAEYEFMDGVLAVPDWAGANPEKEDVAEYKEIHRGDRGLRS